jgi:hypothetical protein
MVAKVVFRALCETVSTTKMIFKGNDGKELIQEVVEGNQEERAYGHDCEIQLPNLLPDSFRTRISDIRDAKKRLREEATRAAKESSAARKESSLRDIHSQTDTGGYYLRTEDSYQPALFSEEGMGSVQRMEKEKEVITEVRVMLSRALGTEVGKYKILNRVLRDMDEQYFEKTDTPGFPLFYYDRIPSEMVRLYKEDHPDDSSLSGYPYIMGIAISVLEDYQETYPKMIKELIDICVQSKQEQQNVI